LESCAKEEKAGWVGDWDFEKQEAEAEEEG